MSTTLSRRAVELRQHPEHPVYMFALKPAEILRVGSISRISRGEGDKLLGYQRDEVAKHISDIQEYLDSGLIIFPNAIILAFDETVTFKASRGPKNDDGVGKAGTLHIPLPKNGGERPGWIVDGQQRAVALSRTDNDALEVPVVAFLGNRVALQRDQFLRVNNARPLPRRLITELLPEVDTDLPRRLAARRYPSVICDLLHTHPDSPFKGMIDRPSFRTKGKRNKEAVVNDTAVVDMLKERILKPGGCLFPYRNMATGETDSEAIMNLLFNYWAAVRDTFPEAWGLPASKSRLMHGAGIKAMGGLMDMVMGRMDPNAPDTQDQVMEELGRIADICRWTTGHWDGLGGMHWKDIQNTPRSVRLLTNHLQREYTLALHAR
jgi:DGQHR domain-containing protein